MRQRAYRAVSAGRTNLAILIALAIVCPLAAMAADTGIGVVNRVAGAATVERSGNSAATALAVGAALFAGDRIATGADGAVGIIMNDGSRFSVGPNSAVVVAEFPYQPGAGLLAEFAARIHGAVQPPAAAGGSADSAAFGLGASLSGSAQAAPRQ